METIEVHIVSAFIDGRQGGNPAGVVIDANALDAKRKLEVARQVGLSETAFVSSSTSATIKLDFFTPNRQIAHCGHATIGTFCLLRQMGIIEEGQHSKETIDGNRKIWVEGEQAYMEQTAPRYTEVAAESELGARAITSLGLTELERLKSVNPCVVNTGNSFLIVPLADEQAVSKIRPDLGTIDAISEELDLIGFYPFSTATKVKGRHAGARMFAPRYGIPEESATGMAAGPLACFLHERLNLPETEMLIEQGWLMQPPSPSVLKVVLELDGSKIAGLMAGGSARLLSTRKATLP